MFILVLFKTAKCPSTNECMKKIWYMYTMKYYSAAKKKCILSFTAKWLELENIMSSKSARHRKSNIACSPSYVEGGAIDSKLQLYRRNKFLMLHSIEVLTI